MASYVRISLATVALICGLGLCRAAHAQGAADKAAAEALFDRGLALMKDNKYQEACERLEQSQAIERGIGTMLYLAECYEKIGRTASAWALFREAASSAQAAGQTERADAGRRRAERLEKDLSRLTLQIPPANRLPDMVVKDNGTQLQRVVWGVALPVDPGVHKIEVSAPGYLSWSSEVKVEDRGSSAEVHVPALSKDPNAAAVATSGSGDASAPAASASSPMAPAAAAPEESMSKLRIVGIVLGAAGIVGIGVGAAMGGVAMGTKKDVKDLQRDVANGDCMADVCAPKIDDGVDDAKKQANVSTAMWIVGGALLAGGLVTFLVAPKHDVRKADVALSLSPQGAGVRVGGVF